MMLEHIFLSVISSSLSVSFMILLLTLFAPLIDRRYAAKWKYWVWILLAFRLVLPIDLTEIQNLFAGTSSGTAAEKSSTANEPTVPAALQTAGKPQAGRSQRILLEIPAKMSEPLTRSAAGSSRDSGITPLMMGAWIWLAGSAVFLCVHLCSYLRYRRRLGRCGIWFSEQQPNGRRSGKTRNRTVADQDTVMKLMQDLSSELRLSKRIPVVEYADADSPMVTGFLHPVLVLPAEDYSGETLYFILKHELIHYMRYDVFWKLLFILANALHWFNPAVWLMRREAVIDMELSCDERVVLGTDRRHRMAYTETLYAALYQQCTGKNPLSTQFHGGKRIMQKRFRNILIRPEKRSGLYILVCAVIFLVSAGFIIGCSASDIDQPSQSTVPEGSIGQNGNSFADTSNTGTAGLVTEDMTNPQRKYLEQESKEGTESLETDLPANTTLTCTLEGESVEMPATLYAGDGYSIYVPDEDWEQYKPDIWRFIYNDQICFRVSCYEQHNLETTRKELGEAYALFPVTEAGRENEMEGQIGEIITRVRLFEQPADNCVWAVFYSYPAEATEGAGARMQVITDTFCIQRLEYIDLWEFDDSAYGAGANVLQFQNGLQIILPEVWMGKTMLEIAASQPSDTRHDHYDMENRLSVCEKNNAEAGYGGELFHMFYVGKYVNDDFTFSAEHLFSIHGEKASEIYRVLGTYRQDGQEYALIYAKYPEGGYDESDINVAPDDPKRRKDYEDLYALTDDVQIITDQIPGFIECDVNDLDWIYIEGLSDTDL